MNSNTKELAKTIPETYGKEKHNKLKDLTANPGA